jgi:hypothetical protein
MKALCEKVKEILPLLEERGPVYLFALFERDDAPGKWDLIVSAQWADPEAAGAVRFVSTALVPRLDKEQLASISRIVIIPSTAPAVNLMASAINIAAGVSEIVDCNFMGLLIKHAFVFRTQHPPVTNAPAPAETATA